MNQPSNPRKKLAKCPSGIHPSQASKHKLRRISSTSTYVIDDEDELERMKNVTLESPSSLDLKKDTSRSVKSIDKTTSSTTFCSGRKAWNHCNAKPSSTFVPDNTIIEEESELIGALTKQLYLVESQMQVVQSNLKKKEEQLKTKDQEVTKLKRKIKDWESKIKEQDALKKKEQQQRRTQKENSEQLYRRCLTLERRIQEMEKFLADYGLIWVGDTNARNPGTPANNYIETCYEQIIANIDQLNLAAGKGEVHVQHNEKGRGATFKTPSCMSLKFYKNGMIVQDGLLRLYDDPATVSFLRDILEGYFPSELQQEYPNGVPFKIEDKRKQMYLGDSVEFPGQGYRLGKQPQADNMPVVQSKPRRPGTTSLKSSRRSTPQKEIQSGLDHTASPSTSRSGKPRSPSVENPPLEMYVLRNQILASHNNVCSDTHLQSHINAELGLSSRKDKRDLATKVVDCDANIRERFPKTKGVVRFPSSGRCYNPSSDRSSSKPSPRYFPEVSRCRNQGILLLLITMNFSSRTDNSEESAKQRTRSSSLPNSRISINSNPRSRPFSGFNNVDESNIPLSQRSHSNIKRNPRGGKPAAPAKPSAPPVLHQVNEPSGKSGELRLKVRSLNGGTVYLVHVSADEPIARLYQLLDKAMSRTVPRGYKIVLSGYSPRRLDQLGATLREIGIARDSVLHLVND
ncbi:uncharacterized protein LOC143212670 [Lasioglossum baleicum]|uniref:uncharacterized protein LOC143212670 n=1 Tax=Lasioglossum baleicum TaxID=434251 RepID=UPI003FCD3697